MTGPVLTYLGETKLELGPAEGMEGHPWRRAEADGAGAGDRKPATPT